MKSAKNTVPDCVNMPYPNRLKTKKISLLLILIVLFSAGDCAGWLKENKSYDHFILPGGLNTKNKSAINYFLTAWKSMESAKLEEAAYYFQLSLKKDPEFPQAFFGLGLVYLKMNKFPEALVFLDLAHDKGQSNAIFIAEIEKTKKLVANASGEWYENIARKAVTENRHGEAIIYLKNALLFKPDDLDLKIQLAESLLQHHDYKESIDLFKTILQIQPDSIPAIRGILMDYVELNDYNSAKSIIESIDFSQISDDKILVLKKHIENRLKVISMPPEYRHSVNKKSITRGDFANLMIHIIGMDNIHKIALKPDPINYIIDISDHWAKNSIITMVSNGIMQVYENSTFRPDKIFTRIELAETIYKILKDRFPEELSDAHSVIFTDVSPINPCYEPVFWIVNRNLMKVSDDHKFYPYNPISGEETQQLLRNINNFLNEVSPDVARMASKSSQIIEITTRINSGVGNNFRPLKWSLINEDGKFYIVCTYGPMSLRNQGKCNF
ncbi:MAG: hypothetical protein A2161_05315 [Candidatus Schekmanbacteria bacterium RBG_13_48_7]|uniref:SLH domain-containing protein n=1 Tax=Candidatus Schekmanbacteria bacterium RBG_13_48_7 TaxID=1817878 RepID=A0A1F7RTY1_9BACT|nr:MAG: hypothetical protein A2161_05315 [Candidatus Schekmanbacteria bacterium RBG_13_48_7]